MSSAREAGPEPRLPAGTASRGPLHSGAGTPVKTASAAVTVGFVALVGCLLVLGLLAEAIRATELNALDSLATPFLHGLASPALDRLMEAFTFIGSNMVIPPLFAVAVAVLLLRRRPREALFLAMASGGSLILNEVMKLLFQRPRPQLPWAHVLPDYSFPSGHTMNSLVFYVGLAVVLWSVLGRRAGVASLATAILVALLIGTSRIYLGYHYLTDVAGGLVAGTAWLLIVAGAFRAGPLSRLGRPLDPAASPPGPEASGPAPGATQAAPRVREAAPPARETAPQALEEALGAAGDREAPEPIELEEP